MFRFGLDENMKKRATKRVDGKIAANFRISGRKSLYYPKKYDLYHMVSRKSASNESSFFPEFSNNL